MLRCVGQCSNVLSVGYILAIIIMVNININRSLQDLLAPVTRPSCTKSPPLNPNDGAGFQAGCLLP